MAIIVSSIKALSGKEAIERAIKKLNISARDIENAEIYKVSKDARKKQLSLVYSISLSLYDKKKESRLAKNLGYSLKSEEGISIPSEGTEKLFSRPVIAGFGPAGMFAALFLSKMGYRPIVIEKGADMDKRVKICEEFFSGGAFSERTNVQFGEGGAGTFSDGKLTTRINDPLCREVLKIFYEMGADEKILYEAKPHIGSDKLREIVKNIRFEIIKNGGEVIFENSLKEIRTNLGAIKSIITDKGEIPCEALILATGHSARDIFHYLYESGIALSSKPFSVGVRIEHRREDINRAMFGEGYDEALFGAAEYQLSLREKDRAVYSFCMCPGGVVVPASSEEGHLVVNGMSFSERNLENSNSALAVSVSAEDFSGGIMAPLMFQRELEKKAYILGTGKYFAPIEYVGSFLGKPIENKVNPSYSIGVTEVNLREILPLFVSDYLDMGIRHFENKIKGFSSGGAVLTGVETRTSSPLRIDRNELRESITLRGLYPCGEGAGYAGGIMSAAVDGIKTAFKIIERYKSFS